MLLSPELSGGGAQAASGESTPRASHGGNPAEHYRHPAASPELSNADIVGIAEADGTFGQDCSFWQQGGASPAAPSRTTAGGRAGASYGCQWDDLEAAPLPMHASQQRAHATSEGLGTAQYEACGTGHRLDFVGGDAFLSAHQQQQSHGHAEDTPSPLDRTLAGAMTDDSFDVGGVASVWDGDVSVTGSEDAAAMITGRRPLDDGSSRGGGGGRLSPSLRVRASHHGDAAPSPRSSSLNASRVGVAAHVDAPPPPASTARPKRHVSLEGSFVVVRELGRGSFSKVFEVVSKADGEHYAVKQSLKEMRSRRERSERLREVVVARKLGVHPHIVDYLLVWQEDQKLHVQMELCAGGSFISAVEAEMLRQAVGSPRPGSSSGSVGGRRSASSSFDDYVTTPKPGFGGAGGFTPAPSPTAFNKIAVPESTIWAFIAQVASGLHHMHSHGFVHLDIKPENILVTRDGSLKLGDLGIATDYAAAAPPPPPSASMNDSFAHNASLHASMMHNVSGVGGMNASFRSTGGMSAGGGGGLASEEEEGDSR